MEEYTLEACKALADSLGFIPLHTTSGRPVFAHRKLKRCPSCGRRSRIEASLYEPGMWLAMCPNCALRTVLVSNPIKAVKAWNEENFTPDSLLTMGKLTKETMTDIGAINLAEALKKRAVRDLIHAEAHGGLDTQMAKDAIWFINNKQVVDDILAGNRRNELNRTGDDDE